MIAVIRGLVFDLDQTLFDRDGAFERFVTDELRRTRLGETSRRAAWRELQELDAHGYGDRGALLDRMARLCRWPVLDRGGSDANPARFRRGLLQNIEPDSRVLDLLKTLRRRYRLGLATDGAAATQEAKIDQLGLRPYFDPIVITDELGLQKPDAAVFEVFVRAWSLRPDLICMIGDHPTRDIAGARRVGMRAIRISAARGVGCRSVLDLQECLP